MASPYARGGSSGGSAYARSAGGGGSPYARSSSGGTPAPAKKSGGGFLSHLGPVGHAVGQVGHYTAKTGLGLASDMEHLPGGLWAMHEQMNRQGATRQHPSQQTLGVLKQDFVTPVITSFEHPGRAPDQTLLNILGIASLGAGAVAKAGALSKALAAGDTGAAVRVIGRTPVKPRLFQLGDKHVTLHPSGNQLVRAMQAIHDRVIRGAAESPHEGLLTRYANHRLGSSLAETRRYQMAVRAAPASTLSGETRKLGAVQDRALRLTAENTTPAERIRFHEQQLRRGVDPAAQRREIYLLQKVEKRGLLTQDRQGNVIVDAAKHPKLAAIDQHQAAAGAIRDQILKDTGQMTEAGLKQRLTAPARVVGEGVAAREGRNYVPYFKTEPKIPRAGLVARAQTPIVGKVQNIPGLSKEFTGKALETAQVPNKTGQLVANQLARSIRYLNSDEFRREIAKTGSTMKRTGQDILVNTQELKNAKVPDEMRTLLHGGKLTTDEVVGHQTAFDTWREQLFAPNSLKGRFKEDRGVALGTEAPEGYAWVPKGLLGDLATPGVGLAGAPLRAANKINAAVTSATVYYKLSHFITRYGTNAVANIIQGSAHPLEIAKSVKMWRALSDTEKQQALGAAGHPFSLSLPHDASGVIGSLASKGAHWWARNADSPFRFNSLRYEASKAGIKTPKQFRALLQDAERVHTLPPERLAVVDRVLKRANREAIAYDRLSEFERRWLTKAIWFYPWLKGSSNFAVNTLLEHPYKAAGIGAIGGLGKKTQQAELGDLPSYEQDLFKVGGTPGLARVMRASTTSPYATPAQILRSIIHINKPTDAEALAQYANPAIGALLGLVEPHKGGLIGGLAKETLGPTPEAQIFKALTSKPSPTKMFPANPHDALMQLLLGSLRKRNLNVATAHSAAAREKKQAGR